MNAWLPKNSNLTQAKIFLQDNGPHELRRKLCSVVYRKDFQSCFLSTFRFVGRFWLLAKWNVLAETEAKKWQLSRQASSKRQKIRDEKSTTQKSPIFSLIFCCLLEAGLDSCHFFASVSAKMSHFSSSQKRPKYCTGNCAALYTERLFSLVFFLLFGSWDAFGC